MPKFIAKFALGMRIIAKPCRKSTTDIGFQLVFAANITKNSIIYII